MKYFIINSDLIELSCFNKNMNQLYIEVDDKGTIKREIGINKDGKVVHAYPSEKFRDGKYGILDLNSFDIKEESNDLSFEDFEKKWNQIV